MIAVFYAMDGEIGEPLEGFSIKEEILLGELQKTKRKRFRGIVREGVIQGREVVLAQIGIWRTGLFGYKGNTQAREVAEYVIERYHPEKILVVGIGGGMEEQLKPGALIVCDPVYAEAKCPVFPIFTRTRQPIHPDEQMTSLAVDVLKERGVTFYSGGDIQSTGYSWIRKRYPGTKIVEMEDYFIAAVAQAKNIPFLAVRVVSEPYGEKLDTSPEYQALWLERYLRITTLLRDEFLLPFLQRL